jgi:hypothetical protein
MSEYQPPTTLPFLDDREKLLPFEFISIRHTPVLLHILYRLRLTIWCALSNWLYATSFIYPSSSVGYPVKFYFAVGGWGDLGDGIRIVDKR